MRHMQVLALKERAAKRPAPLNVVLLSHWGRSGYNVLRALTAMGARTFLIHDSRSASLRFSRCCKVVHSTSEIAEADPATVIRIINDLHRSVGIDSVIASDVESLTLLARMKPDLRAPVFPIAELSTLLLLNNKWEFYKLCVAQGVAAPKTLFVEDKSAIDPADIAAELSFPVVVKPVAGYGQRGILILSDTRDLETRLLRNEAYDYGGMVIQEFVEGCDWALSVFARNGAIEHWTAWACPGQLEAEYGIGRFMTTAFCDRRDLMEMGEKIIAATGFSGVANFDARFDVRSDSMKMFECNPRFFNRMLAARFCGLDFVRVGLPGAEIGAKISLDQKHHYPWQELFSVRGARRLLNGEWKPSLLARDVFELLIDPLPPIMRKITHEDARS
jgi:predicted ATP-grasp superfamily ATP-dependent carboligase